LLLARKFPEVNVYAVDFSKSMCDITRKRVKKEGLNNVIVNVGDIENLKFDDGFFDVVLCIDTLHHIPNKSISKGLGELSRVVKKSGVLVVDFKNRNNPVLYYQHKRRNRASYYRTSRTLKEMRKFLDKVNVRIEKVNGFSPFSMFTAPYVNIFCKKNWICYSLIFHKIIFKNILIPSSIVVPL